MDPSPQSPDFAVREIEVTSPRLREDLRWTFQEVGNEGGYLLEDPLNGRFFRLGLREYRFVKSLDGRRNIAEIVAELASNRDEAALDTSQASSLVRMLIDAGLVVTGDSEHADRVFDEVNRPKENQQILGKMGQILFLRLPLGNPDRFFQFLARQFGWIASPAFFLVWLTLIAWGGFSIRQEWERFSAQMSGLFDFGNLWILGILWIVLKAFHECWHGLVCRKFGGAVPEGGVTLLLLTTPLGYVNASSSAGFPSKWQRIAVASAGIYGELFLAAIAAILWARVEPGAFGAALHQIIVLSSITTLLFNANPLMRFDGYYILSDLLDIPNLYGKGQSMSRWLFRRWVLGIPKAKSPLRPTDNAFVIALYGIAAGIWRVLVVVGLIVAASALFEGAGLIIALVAAAAMILQGLSGIIRYLKKSAAGEGLRPARLFLRVTALVGILVAALMLIKVTPTAKAPAVVRNTGGGEVRSECPGFLSEVIVASGARVEEGDLLLRLENVEERTRLKKLEAEIERSQLKANQFLSLGQLAAWQAETENLQSLESTYTELKDFVATLEVRSPRAGVVHSRHLDSLRDTWIQSGQMLMSVGSKDTKELIVMASQEDWDRFEEAQLADRPLEFRLRGRLGTASANFRDMQARATTEPAHFALITSGGGPIPVRQRTKAQDSPPSTDAEASAAARFELMKPRFEIHAIFDASEAESLLDGEIGIAIARASDEESLASLALREAKSRLDRLIASRSGS